MTALGCIRRTIPETFGKASRLGVPYAWSPSRGWARPVVSPYLGRACVEDGRLLGEMERLDEVGDSRGEVAHRWERCDVAAQPIPGLEHKRCVAVDLVDLVEPLQEELAPVLSG